MALISLLPSPDHHHPMSQPKAPSKIITNTNKTTKKKKKKKRSPSPLPLPPPPKPTSSSSSSSWDHFKSLLSCKNAAAHQPVAASAPANNPSLARAKYVRLGSHCGSSICAIRDVVHGNTRVVHRPEVDPAGSTSSASDSGSHSEVRPLSARPQPAASRGGMQLMKLSGCYECHAVDAHSASRRYPRPRTLCPCTECGEVFTKSESLELHQAVRHAVSELGPEDSGRHIVEIIFKSSWQKCDKPAATIERILKVHNTDRTIARFEDYRDSIKSKSLLLHHHPPSRKNPRCAADGNELLRFHCTSLSCPLGLGASTSLCISNTNSAPCSVCTIIRYGFSRAHQGPKGVQTTASSGRAHDCGPRVNCGPTRAMLVCRVIAGRVRSGDGEESSEIEGSDSSLMYDSVAEDSRVEELFVANPRAILPCFVVIYRALD